MNPNQPGQPINTEDAMNDLPQDDSEAYKAWSKMSADELNAHHDAIVNDFAGETNTNDKTGKERTESLFDLYPRQAGESNEEYSARLRKMSEMKKQFAEEHPIEDAEESPAEEVPVNIVKDEAAEAEEKAKMEMAEKIRKEVPEALEYLNQHPELRTQMAAAVKKLEELEAIANTNSEADAQIDAELAKRNETFMNAVEAFNAAARANEAARAKMNEFEKKGTGTDAEYNEILDEIHQTEQDMDTANAEKEKAEADYDQAEALIRGVQEKKVNEINERIDARDKYAAEEKEYFEKNYREAEASYNVAKQMNEDARAEMADLEKRADAGEKITDEQFQAAEDKIHAAEIAMQKSEARMEELKQDQVDAAEVMEEWVDRDLANKAAADEAEPAKAEADAEDPEWEKFLNSYINDKDFREIYTREGVFDEEACRSALRNMYEAKMKQEATAEKNEEEMQKVRANSVNEMLAEEAEAEANPDDGFETAEQRGLFAKLKNFFKGNARSKAGAERATKQWGMTGFRRLALAGLYGMMILTSLSSAFAPKTAAASPKAEAPNMGPQVVYAAEAETPAQSMKADLNNIADNLTLKADLNAEMGEELSDLIDTTAYGEDIEVNISYGDYGGSSEFLDYENKHGIHNLTRELYDMGNENLTDVQKAEQIAEGLANVLDDPIEQGQFAALGGADVQIDGKTNGITKLEDMNDVLDLAQQDDEFRQSLAEYNKEMFRKLVDEYDLQVERRVKGSLHQSIYAYELTLEDGSSDLNYAVDKDGVRAQEDFDVLQFVDEDGQNVLDKNDIDGYKYNFLKGIGIIPEDATDEEAQDIMSKIRIIGFSGKCGQLIWENITPDTGSETGTGTEPDTGNENGTGTEPDTGTEHEPDTGTENEPDTGTENEPDTGTENEPDTGTENEPDTGTENEPDTGTEHEPDTGTENEPDTGTEHEPDTGTENEPDTGTEHEPDTGTETEPDTGTETEPDTGTEIEPETGTEVEPDTGTEDEYDGKTDTIVDDGGSNTEIGETQTETGDTSEAGANVDDGGNGMADDHDANETSTVHDDTFLNNGDQGGGNTDADGGGSTDTDTEATFNGGETSGFNSDNSQESGTTSVDESGSNNDSEANQDSAGEDRPDGEGASDAMDRIG